MSSARLSLEPTGFSNPFLPTPRQNYCVLLQFLSYLPNSSDNKMVLFQSGPLVFWGSIINCYSQKQSASRKGLTVLSINGKNDKSSV